MTINARDLHGLKKIDQATKPCDADSEFLLAHSYYEDRSRTETIQRLKDIGAGLADNRRPLEVALLRRVIDRLAVVYDRAPTRWLTDTQGARKPEDSLEHKAMIDALSRAQYDLAWRKTDRLRALMRQMGLRFYPSDSRGSVVIRMFEPYNMIRQPNPGAPDQIEQDERFALRLAGTPGQSGADEVWEYWDREDSGEWRMAWVNQAGELLDKQPYQSTGLRNPYTELPVQMIFDDFNSGVPWFAPRCSRTAWQEAINAMSNDLWALILHEAHDQKTVSTDNTQDVPKEHGPGKVWALPKDATASVLSGNPKLKEAQDILDNFVRLWSLSEDLPASEFDKSKQVVTGATLKVQNRPLLSRREAMIPLAFCDEPAAYRKFRAVHNLHTAAAAKDPKSLWNQLMLDETLTLEVEPADVDIPTDLKEIQESGARSLAIGTKSVLDLIQKEDNVTRSVAIKTYNRVKEDNDKYPPKVDPGTLANAAGGPRMAGVHNGPETMAGKASVTDAIKDAA